MLIEESRGWWTRLFDLLTVLKETRDCAAHATHDRISGKLQLQTPARIVCTSCFCGITLRIMRGFEVSNDALMLDLIDQVGPGGEFMSQGVTAKR